jgi:hypothetical protein
MTSQIHDYRSKAHNHESYVRLLKAARNFASAFILVRRQVLSEHGHAVLHSMDSELLERRNCREWPGTKLLSDEEAEINKFILTSRTENILAEAVPHLWAWVQPEMPEDLSFLRADGRPWFVSIAHERDAYFKLEEAEVQTVLELIAPASVQGVSIDSCPDERY